MARRRRTITRDEVRRALERDYDQRQAAFTSGLAAAEPNWTALLSLHLQLREVEFLMECLEKDVWWEE